MAANSSKAKMALGFSLHVRAEEAISKFQKEIEEDFNYLHEILAEAKQHFGRRDSNILLPKTPSMKRKHQESDDEQSSDDNIIKTTRGIKAPKTQGYASPLTVINENEPLDCSGLDEETKQESNKRTTRATRAGAQAKRQQPKKGLQKNDLSANEEQTDSSSMDEKPRRNTRNSRKKMVEKGAASSTNDHENKLPKRSTRNTRKKILEDTAEISSTEELPPQPVSKKSMSSIGKKMEDSEEVVPVVMVIQEPALPVDEMQSGRRSTRNSNSRKEEEKEMEIIVPVPETPDLPTDVTKNVMSPPTSAKTCKASVQLILQSPGFNNGKENGLTPIITSSPCVEQDPQSHDITVEEIVQSEKKDDDAVTVCSVVSSTLLESADSLKNELHESDSDISKKEDHMENQIKTDENCDATDGIAINEEVNKENMEGAVPGLKSGRRSSQRNSGWRKKSKRSSQRFSPANRRLSIKKTVTKSKTPGKKSLIKSSVKLKLTQSKLMPELKLNGSVQIIDDKASEPNLEGVRVRLFETFENSPSASSATSRSSCSSNEDKADVPVEKLVEEPTEDDVGEVFHDYRGSENEADDETENTQRVETDSNKSLAVVTVMSSPVTSHDSSGGEGSEAASVGTSDEIKTPPQEKQEAVNPAQKAKPSNIALVHSFIRRNTPKKVDPEEKKKQLRIALKEKEEKEKERREYLEMQKQREIEERRKRREERAKKAAEQRAAKLEAFEKKKRQAEDQRQINEEKAKKIKDKEDEDKRKQRLQKKAELEARRKQEEAARQQRKREQEEDEKRQREALLKKQELDEQERQRKIAEAKRHQEHREKELEKEREMEKQRKLKAIEDKEKRLREKEEKSREEKQRIEREREERERARIAQLIREKEEAVRREREQRAREDKGRQDREKKLKEEREATLRETRRQEEVERERIRVLEERKLAAENHQRSCDSYEMTPPPVRIRKPASQENYNIADLNSDDSTDDEDNPRKKIPAWARPPALTAAIFRQEYSDIDVNSIFDSVPAPKLEEIFTKKKPRYNQRTSSAIWNSPPLKPLKKGTFV